MTTFSVGYLIGSLAKAIDQPQACPRSDAPRAPEHLQFKEIPIGDLPLYSYDYDADYPPVAKAFKDAIARRRRRAVRDAGIQPLDPGRAEERNRLGKPPLRQEFVRTKALRRDRHLAGRHRHGRRPAAICAACSASATRRR